VILRPPPLPFLFLLLLSLLLPAAFAQDAAEPPIRVAVRARGGAADRLTPLRYLAGFETKTLLYETLVKRGPDGRLVPGLATWQIEDGGTAFRFRLREGARYHDGSPVTARSVQTHFRRWVGLPEHDWLPANRHITRVDVDGDDTFVVHLDEPYPLLSDLAAINPCAIVAPGARDWEGEFRRPMGSGPFRFVGTNDDGSWLLQRDGPEPVRLEVRGMPRSNLDPANDEAPLDALAAGELDVFVCAWDEDLPPARIDAFDRDPAFVVDETPGSSVVYLSFRLLDGPTSRLDVRRRVAAAVDRDALIRALEGGRATPCTAWAAPSIRFWPRRPSDRTPVETPADAPRVPLRIAAARLNPRARRVAEAVAAQLRPHGFDVEVVELRAREKAEQRMQESGDAAPLTLASGSVRAAANREVRRVAETADLCVEITHGAPYDPQLTLVSRWGPFANHNEDEPRPENGVDAELRELVTKTMSVPDELECVTLYAQIQQRMDEQALIVPLYSPHRMAIRAAAVEGVVLGPDLYRVDLRGLRRVDTR